MLLKKCREAQESRASASRPSVVELGDPLPVLLSSEQRCSFPAKHRQSPPECEKNPRKMRKYDISDKVKKCNFSAYQAALQARIKLQQPQALGLLSFRRMYAKIPRASLTYLSWGRMRRFPSSHKDWGQSVKSSAGFGQSGLAVSTVEQTRQPNNQTASAKLLAQLDESVHGMYQKLVASPERSSTTESSNLHHSQWRNEHAVCRTEFNAATVK